MCIPFLTAVGLVGETGATFGSEGATEAAVDVVGLVTDCCVKLGEGCSCDVAAVECDNEGVDAAVDVCAAVSAGVGGATDGG